MWAGLVPPEPPLLGSQMAIFPLCPHVVITVRTCILTSGYKDTSHIGLGPPRMTSSHLDHPFKDQTSHYSFPVRSCKLELHDMNLGDRGRRTVIHRALGPLLIPTAGL